jgi:AcrR family transcriptional regulator
MKSARWKRRKEERTPEILEAALACFGEKGFAATRMDDVAARAGITKGTIYLYFDSKQAVFKALARQSAGAQIAAIAEQVKTSDTPSPELLRFVILSMGQFLRTTDGARSSTKVLDFLKRSSSAASREANSASCRPSMPRVCASRRCWLWRCGACISRNSIPYRTIMKAWWRRTSRHC